jgi:hypothetical protein
MVFRLVGCWVPARLRVSARLLPHFLNSAGLTCFKCREQSQPRIFTDYTNFNYLNLGKISEICVNSWLNCCDCVSPTVIKPAIPILLDFRATSIDIPPF